MEQNNKHAMYIIDTETSGFLGCHIPHKQHRLLQLCCLCLSDQSLFIRFLKYEEQFIITSASTKIHGITNQYIQEHGVTAIQCMNDFTLWVKEKSQGKKPLFVAHAANFDRDIILKTFPSNNGKGGINLNVQWLDSLGCIKDLYPEIQKNANKAEYQTVQFRSQPYSLQSLVKHFYGDVTDDFHNAEIDCKWLSKLYIQHILPKINDELNDCNYENIKGMILSNDIVNIKRELNICKKLSDVKFIKSYIPQIVRFINKEFLKREAPFCDYVTNEKLITIGHLVTWAWITTLLYTETEGGNKKVDSWYSICMRIEYMLRTQINIYSDEMILEVLSLVCNRSPSEVAHNSIQTIERKSIFPTLAGTPASYLPFVVTNIDAIILLNKFGFETAHDLYIDFCIYSDISKKQHNGNPMKGWCNKIITSISTESRDYFLPFQCEQHFERMIPGLKFS